MLWGSTVGRRDIMLGAAGDRFGAYGAVMPRRG